MADNITLNPGSGGDAVRADEVSSYKYQWIKVAAGGDGDAADNGPTLARKVSVGTSADATNYKGAKGILYSVVAVNTGASVAYLHYYNKATSPTVGTDTPVLTFPLPAGGGVAWSLSHGAGFATGIGLGISTTVGGSTGVSADQVIVTTIYV